jgi:DNA polymerase I-like protein with 3'-5' exonuclease and polymerase domains
MRVAAVSLYDCDRLYSDGIHFIAPVHDEFVWSVRLDKLEDLAKRAVKFMTSVPADFTVPMDVGLSIGLNFADQHEVTLDNLMDKAKELVKC